MDLTRFETPFTSQSPMLTLPPRLSFPITTRGALGGALRALGLARFDEALRFVHSLPYGRNSDRADPRLVLVERRGTCSTKHAFLASVGREHGQPIRLSMGIFMMNEANTARVGHALSSHGLTEIPEAHCYLVEGALRIDVTHPGSSGLCDLELHDEHALEPEDIGTRKVAFHRAFLQRWAADRGLDVEGVWAAREACIAALARPR